MHKKWITGAVCGMVALGMAIAMTLPAKATLVCEREEHTHTKDCYRTELFCGLEETEGHTHTDACYEITRELICPLQEGDVTHVHDESCYSTKTEYICGLEESPSDPGHTHSDSCYNEDGELICGQEERPAVTGHTHTADCMRIEKVLTCTQSTEPHVHTDACWKETRTLICTQEERPPHHHTDECYRTVGDPICGKEEHVHSVENDCFANPTDGIEYFDDWEKMFKDFEYTGDWPTDLVAVAESQLGTMESLTNFRWDSKGFRHGYTRYSHWQNSTRYGENRLSLAYEWWCADFVSFCTNYAGIPQEYMPLQYNCQLMRYNLQDRDYFALYKQLDDGSYTYEPRPGDVIFFDYDRDDWADHVGIVKCVEPEVLDEEGKVVTEKTIVTIEGNNGRAVREARYAYYYAAILGFGETWKAYQDYQFEQARLAELDGTVDENGSIIERSDDGTEIPEPTDVPEETIINQSETPVEEPKETVEEPVETPQQEIAEESETEPAAEPAVEPEPAAEPGEVLAESDGALIFATETSEPKEEQEEEAPAENSNAGTPILENEQIEIIVVASDGTGVQNETAIFENDRIQIILVPSA